MAEFARPYPALSFFDAAINAPAEDIEKVAYLASKSGTPNDPEAAECWAGLSRWIADFIETRRKGEPRGDVVDAVIDAEIEGRPITDEEIVGTVQLLILGGLETTAGALGSMMIRFCRQPEVADALRSDPASIPRAVEELLRLDGPFIAIARTATRDTEIQGRPIKKGEKVIIYWAAACRDESEFPDPDRFDLDRESNRHLAFGAGPHRCAGSNLARLNLKVALEELLPRLADLRLQDGADIHFHSTFNRAPRSVPITFTPAG
jgi:cytochrome P450